MTATQDTVSGMPGRYGLALFELASEQNKIAEVGKSLAGLAAMIRDSDDLQRLVSSPVFGTQEQSAAIESILAKAKVSGIAANFVKLVTEKRRLFAIGDMIVAYQALVARQKGEVVAQVTSAQKLTGAQITKIKTSLKAAVGQDVTLETTIDPEVLGGLIIKVGSKMIDDSLRTKLQSMKIAMKGA